MQLCSCLYISAEFSNSARQCFVRLVVLAGLSLCAYGWLCFSCCMPSPQPMVWLLSRHVHREHVCVQPRLAAALCLQYPPLDYHANVCVRGGVEEEYAVGYSALGETACTILYTTCIPLVYYMYTAYILHVKCAYYLYSACILLVYCMYTTCILHVYYS